jgi:23S rRNA (cytosine1962-C5)-methyltransferase
MKPLETAVVSPRGAGRIRGGHPWLFRSDVLRGPARDGGDGPGDAAQAGPLLVAVSDGRGRRLGVATWAARARIALRMVARGSEPDPEDLPSMIDARLAAALARRSALALDRDAYRVAHAESDGLPGLIVDRYADAAVIQTTSVAMNATRDAIAEIVARRLEARIVIARDDGSARDGEDLPRFAGVLAGGGDTRVIYRLGPNRLEADLLTDGKTGGFLDQADNHARVARAAARLAPPAGASAGRALDAFTYHGGFALALARSMAGAQVLALDQSESASARAAANATRNGLANLKVEQANAFDRLRALEAAGATFDVVVLDPPALAKRGAPSGPAGLGPAARAYKELVLRGARITTSGGLLVACSCSGRITRAQWEEICVDALADAGRPAHVLWRGGAGRDHPELAGVPETGHLKVWMFRML